MDDIWKCFRALGLEPEAGPKAVKKAYRDLVKRWHPDLVQGSAEKQREAEEKIKEINLAFERIQELRPSDLMALRLSRAAPRPASASAPASTSPFQPGTRPIPKPPSAAAPSPSGPAEFHPRDGVFKGPATSTSTAPGDGTFGWRRFTGASRVVGVTLAFVVLGVGLGILFSGRHAPPASDSVATRPVSMAELDRLIDQNRSETEAAPQSTIPGQSAASATAGLAGPAASVGVGRPIGGGRGISDLTASVVASTARRGAPWFDPTPESDPVPPATPVEVSAEAEEHFRRGRRYASGEEGFEDYAEAVKWYRAAAEAGHPEAQRNLGLLFAAGKGVPQDFAEAEKWLTQASAQGQSGAELAGAIIALAKSDAQTSSKSPEPLRPDSSDAKPEDGEALYSRALRHARGEGVPQDLAEAARWYRRAAEAGHAGAQKSLGLSYATGQGVARDDAEAQKWLRKAAAQGQAGADLASTLLTLRKSLNSSPGATNQASETNGNGGAATTIPPTK